MSYREDPRPDQGANGRRPRTVAVCSSALDKSQGWLVVGGLRMRCALGRAGCVVRKREGDGATPIGRWRILYGVYRRDRGLVPQTRIPMRALRPDQGWCDDPGDRNYNRPVRLPYPGRAEQMERTDHLYDVVLITSHNRRPRVRGRGSAIFIHLARPGFAPTEGCIALARRDIRLLLSRLKPGVVLHVSS